jgi:hypothetical protein
MHWRHRGYRARNSLELLQEANAHRTHQKRLLDSNGLSQCFRVLWRIGISLVPSAPEEKHFKKSRRTDYTYNSTLILEVKNEIPVKTPGSLRR